MLAAVREGGECRQSEVDTDFSGGFWHHRERLVNPEGDGVAAGGRAANVYRGGIGRKAPRPANLQPADLRQGALSHATSGVAFSFVSAADVAL